MRIHFSGIGGAGMNPLARLFAARGHQVQGSDRGFDQGSNQTVAELLRADGITLLPQDGSAIGANLDRVVHSAAVEPTVPEMVAAADLKIPCQARPALLAEVVDAGNPGVAIAGTSGKSTVTGMLAWILRQCQRPATVLGGAALAEAGASHMGCFAAAGDDAPVIAEACESDGTIVGYHPGVGLVHNISRDHHEVAELIDQFSAFAANSERLLIGYDCPAARTLMPEHPARVTYGRDPAADIPLEVVRAGPWRAEGTVTIDDAEVFIDLPQPGEHNLDNALAALVAARCLGVAPAAAAAALATFPGVARRFQVVGTTGDGITVVDDYAHNPAKIAAAVQAAQLGTERLLVVFQPHGFGPARFMRPDLKELLPGLLRRQDRWCFAEIFYAGGTVQSDISSRDLAADQPASLRCGYAPDHPSVLTWVSEIAAPGDTVLVLGARDPALPGLAQALVNLL